MKKLLSLLFTAVMLCSMLAVFTVPTAAATTYNCGSWDDIANAIKNDSSGDIRILLTSPKIQSDYQITINKSCHITFVTNLSLFYECIINGGNHRAFYLKADNIDISFGDCVRFQNFTGSEEGGAIYVEGEDCGIHDGCFEYCRAEYGGAIYLYEVGAYVAGCAFDNNKADEDGGAIYVDDDAKIYSCNFKDNEAGEDGGSIYDNNEVGDVFIRYCTFSGGDCGDDGIWVYCNGDAIIEDCTKGDDDYYDDPDGDSDSSYTGSLFSGGTLWVIIGVAAVAVAAAVVILVVVKKKKKPAVADATATENPDEDDE